VMRNAIALNGSFFNTERMAAEYAADAYGLAPAGWVAPAAGDGARRSPAGPPGGRPR